MITSRVPRAGARGVRTITGRRQQLRAALIGAILIRCLLPLEHATCLGFEVDRIREQGLSTVLSEIVRPDDRGDVFFMD